jgi:hypothetical protein
MIIISGPQLWKLDIFRRLLNKEGVWISDEKWNFKTVSARLEGKFQFGKFICIENINKTKVLGTKNDKKVILEKFEEGKHEQLWKKGEPNAEGYFTLENDKVSKFMTATSSTTLEVKGDITKLKEDNGFKSKKLSKSININEKKSCLTFRICPLNSKDNPAQFVASLLILFGLGSV